MFIFIGCAYGYTYNDLLLKAQAFVFPKVIMLDKKVDKKLINDKIVYTIVYEKNDIDTALEIERVINAKYKKHFGRYEYKIELVEFENISESIETSAIYVLNSEQHIEKVAEIARQKGVISFAYDMNNLKRGVLFSLMLEKSTTLYLNKNNLITDKVDFVDSLLQMLKFIE